MSLREAFLRDGVVAAGRVLSDVEAVREGLGAFPSGASFHPTTADDHPLVSWAAPLLAHAPLLDAVEAVLGPDLLVRNVDVFVRRPWSRDGVRWHRDTAVDAPGADRMLTAWLALSPATWWSGALTYARGSHRVRLPGESLSDDALTLPSAVARGIDRRSYWLAVAAPGDLVLHHHATLHRSGGNWTGTARVGVAIRFGAGDIDPRVFQAGVAQVVRGALRHPGILARPTVPIVLRG